MTTQTAEQIVKHLRSMHTEIALLKDFIDAANFIESQAAEIERLREALTRIAEFDYKLRPTPQDLRDAARAALEKQA